MPGLATSITGRETLQKYEREEQGVAVALISMHFVSS